MHGCMLSCFSHVQLFATLWTIACQAPLSMGFSRQEDWSGLPRPSSRRSSRPRDQIHISYITCIGRWVLYHQGHLGSGTHIHTHTTYTRQIHSGLSVIKKDEIPAPMWINLESIIHSEISQTNTLYHLHVDLKTKTNELHSKTNRNRLTDVGNGLVATNEERKGGRGKLEEWGQERKTTRKIKSTENCTRHTVSIQ